LILGSPDRTVELAGFRSVVVDELNAAHEARESGLAACRETIRSCSRSIRMVHRLEFDAAREMADSAEASLRRAQNALADHPRVKYAGFLHDAEKEYAEARLVSAFVGGLPLIGPGDLEIGIPAWLNGLTEAASELRRFLLDQLRSGQFDRGDELLEVMDDVYELLVGIDYPDAITGGLRRSTDAYRAVLERTRSDYTTAFMQARLQKAIEERLN
jgi:translin